MFEVTQAAFAVPFLCLSDVHKCSGDFCMAPSPCTGQADNQLYITTRLASEVGNEFSCFVAMLCGATTALTDAI